MCIFFKLVCKGHRYFTAKQLPIQTCQGPADVLGTSRLDGKSEKSYRALVLLLNKSKHVAMSSLHYRDFSCNYPSDRFFQSVGVLTK